MTTRDYGASGLTIQVAMLDHWKRFPDKALRPDHILWHGLHVTTGDVLNVAQTGIVRGEFLAVKKTTEQGFDIKIADGWVQLEKGEHIPHLRTWHDENLDDIVEYPYFSRDCKIWVWNVYKMHYPGGQIVEERWTQNAGMWVEEISPMERIYHCSSGMADPPDFESLVFRITVSPSGADFSLVPKSRR